MTEWFYHLPVVWMSVVVFLATAVVTAAIYGAVVPLATGDRGRAFKAVSPVMLTPLAVVFGLIVGFLAAQVWADSDRAHAAVTREATALRSVVIFSASFPDATADRMRSLVRRYIQEAVSQEWPAMADQRSSLAMITAAEDEALQLALSVRPQNEAQIVAQREIVASLRSALEARQQRIIISRSTINWVKWAVVGVLAALVLLTIAIIHSDNRATAAITMAIFAIAVTACIVLIAAHNRPFTGQISVGPELLRQVMPKE